MVVGCFHIFTTSLIEKIKLKSIGGWCCYGCGYMFHISFMLHTYNGNYQNNKTFGAFIV